MISLTAFSYYCNCVCDHQSRHGLHWHRAAGGRPVPRPCWWWRAELQRHRDEAGPCSMRWDSERNTSLAAVLGALDYWRGCCVHEMTGTCPLHLILCLSPVTVKELVRDIEQLQCLRALRLEGNSVGVEAARAIAKALEGKDLLQVLLWKLIFISLFLINLPLSWIVA